MKKIVVLFVGLLCFAPAAFADNWGLGLRLGAAESDPKALQDAYDATPTSKELDKGYGVFSLEALYEWNLEDEANKIGAKIGLDFYGATEFKVPGYKAEETTYSFPVTVYYKRDNGIKNWSWFGGAGVTFLRSEIEESGVFNETTSKTKAFPHLTVGAEYRFSELFALGLDAKYNIGAKVKKDGGVLSDRSGFGMALTGRFYF